MLLSTPIDSQIIQSQEARLLVYWSRPDLFEPYGHSLPHTIKAFPLHRSFCPADAADAGRTHTSHAPPPSRVCAPPDIIGLRAVCIPSFLPRTIAVSIIRVRRSVSSISGCIKSRDHVLRLQSCSGTRQDLAAFRRPSCHWLDCASAYKVKGRGMLLL